MTSKFRIVAALIGLVGVLGLVFPACAGPDNQVALPAGLATATIYKSRT